MPESLEDARSPARVFLQQVPKAFMRDVLRCLYKCYEAAWEECAGLPEEEAHDLRPHYRRALFEAGLRDVAQRYSTVKATTKRNRMRNYSHTYIRCGRVLLTESAVESPDQMIRRAEFRATYARYNQLFLWDKPLPPPATAPLYAVLIHGASTDPRQPLFARIKFPGPDCAGYIEGNCIDLFEMFKEDVVKRQKRLESTPKPKLVEKPETA